MSDLFAEGERTRKSLAVTGQYTSQLNSEGRVRVGEFVPFWPGDARDILKQTSPKLND